MSREKGRQTERKTEREIERERERWRERKADRRRRRERKLERERERRERVSNWILTSYQERKSESQWQTERGGRRKGSGGRGNLLPTSRPQTIDRPPRTAH